MDEKTFWHISLRVPKVTIIFIVFVAAFYAAVFYYTEWPRPLVLKEPQFPQGAITISEEVAMRDWYSGNQPSGPKTHVWRKQYVIGLGGCCEELNSPENILASLEEWMNSQGWVRWEEVGDPCGDMAEIEFLERDTEYVPYVPTGTKNLLHSPSVCVAVWPWTEDAYSVLVVTAKE